MKGSASISVYEMTPSPSRLAALKYPANAGVLHTAVELGGRVGIRPRRSVTAVTHGLPWGGQYRLHTRHSRDEEMEAFVYKCLKSLSQEPGWPVVFLLLETGHASGGRPWLLRYNRGRMRRKNTRLSRIASSAFLLVCLVPGARALDAIVLDVRELSVDGVPIEGASARLELLSDQTTRMTLTARSATLPDPIGKITNIELACDAPGDCRAALRLRYSDAHGRGRA